MNTPKKITLAAQDRMARVEYLAPRFFAEVVGVDYADCLVTDESDLHDFSAARGAVPGMLKRFEQHYLITPPKGCTLVVPLLEFLAAHGVES